MVVKETAMEGLPREHKMTHGIYIPWTVSTVSTTFVLLGHTLASPSDCILSSISYNIAVFYTRSTLPARITPV